jgi:agmatinase
MMTCTKKARSISEMAEFLIDEMAAGEDVSDKDDFDKINVACAEMNAWVKERCLHFLKQNKTVGLIGGDHSTPLGMIHALAEHHGNFGILQLDAHADLRVAYEGFEFSHASIMYNALKTKEVEKLVQVGIRDFCEEEVNIINESKGRVVTFFDRDLKHESYNGETWAQACKRIVHELPQNIYLSFDIDALDPKLVPKYRNPCCWWF